MKRFRTSISVLFLFGIILLTAACNEDPCEDITCNNGGTCADGLCECPDGFIGDDCSIVDATNLIGNYSGRYEGCFQTAPDHVVQLDQSEVSGFAVTFINLGDYACPGNSDNRVRVEANFNGNSIEMPEQTVCGDSNFEGYTFDGTGTVFTDSIRLDFNVNYTVDGNSRTDNCTAILVR